MVVPETRSSRIEAALTSAVAAAPEQASALVEDLLATVEVVADSGGLDEAALRQSGLGTLPPGGLGGVVLRAVPYGLLSPLDRPRMRRGAFRCGRTAGADEGSAMVAVASAILCADLQRFDLDTSLMRLRQTLLEEAPTALLDRLVSLPELLQDPDDADPAVALQRSITLLAGGGEAVASKTGVSEVLAGALRGAASGEVADAAYTHPLGDRLRGDVRMLAEAAERVTARVPARGAPAPQG